MPIPIPTKSNSENEYEYDCPESESELDSESSTLTGDDDDDDDEYFIRFDSNTNYDNVEYVMICDTCYTLSDNNTSPIQDYEEEDDDCLECKHYVMVYFINGYVEQQMMDKNEINDICRLQGIDISSNDVFKHLLE